MEDGKSNYSCPKKAFLSRLSTDSDLSNHSPSDGGQKSDTERKSSGAELLAFNGILSNLSTAASFGERRRSSIGHQRVDSISQMSLPDDLQINFSELDDTGSIQLDDIDLTYSPSPDVDLTTADIRALEQGKDGDSQLQRITSSISSTTGAPQYAPQLAQEKVDNGMPVKVNMDDIGELGITKVKEEEPEIPDYNFEGDGWKMNAQQVSTVGSSGQGLKKRKAVSPRKTNKQKHLQNIACQVCGDIAAGFYCGAYICEACKKFYMRAYKQDKLKYVCLRDKKCVITKESRVQCQYCRYQKCTQLNMYCPKQGDSESGKDMHMSEIPCRVCSAPSSGFHFGAITCEGCKGFFRRMAKEREAEKYQCNKSGNCEINMITRNLCKACRYQACIRAGMCVEDGYPVPLETGLGRVKEEPLDNTDDYLEREKSSDTYSWDQWANEFQMPVSTSNQESLSEDQFLPTIASTVFTSCANPPLVSISQTSGSANFQTPTSSSTVDSSVLQSREPSLDSSSQKNWTGYSFSPPNTSENPLSYSSGQMSAQTSRTSTPYSTSPQSFIRNTFSNNQFEAALGKKLLGDSNSKFQNANYAHFHHQKPVEIKKTFSMNFANNPVKLNLGYAPAYNPNQAPEPGFNMNRKDLNATPLETLPGNSNMRPVTSSQSFSPPAQRQPRAPQFTSQNSHMTQGFPTQEINRNSTYGSDPDMSEFIRKTVDAGKCLQLLNYRVFDTDINPTTSMDVDEIKALFKCNYMDPKEGNHIKSKADMSMFSTRESTWNYMMTNFHNNTYITIRFAKLVPEIHGLEDPQAVEALQSQISVALQYYEEETFQDGLTRYGILLVRVAELVQCLLQHNLAIGLLLTHNPTIKVPQLFHELIIESIKEGQK
ncbi:HR3-like protein [Mya arenaria]|uniref:HR3-like protein n=1 Tax=Mya arenaria TaxID=6604 RepID=A0ABY7FEL2_MYAAR|nr:HR3-like protein [Mya arenaria]